MLETAVPVNSAGADSKKADLDNAKSVQSYVQFNVKAKSDQIKSLLYLCLQNAELHRTQANQSLTNFVSVQTRLDSKKD